MPWRNTSRVSATDGLELAGLELAGLELAGLELAGLELAGLELAGASKGKPGWFPLALFRIGPWHESLGGFRYVQDHNFIVQDALAYLIDPAFQHPGVNPAGSAAVTVRIFGRLLRCGLGGSCLLDRFVKPARSVRGRLPPVSRSRVRLFRGVRFFTTEQVFASDGFFAADGVSQPTGFSQPTGIVPACDGAFSGASAFQASAESVSTMCALFVTPTPDRHEG